MKLKVNEVIDKIAGEASQSFDDLFQNMLTGSALFKIDSLVREAIEMFFNELVRAEVEEDRPAEDNKPTQPIEEQSRDTVKEVFSLRCPRCLGDGSIQIVARIWVELYPDGTEPLGDHEWNSESPARCFKCDFSGTVLDFDVEEQARRSSDGERS